MVGIGNQHTDLCRPRWSITELDAGIGAGGGIHPPRPTARYSCLTGRHSVEEEMEMLAWQLRRETGGLIAYAVAVAAYTDGGNLRRCTAAATPFPLD